MHVSGQTRWSALAADSTPAAGLSRLRMLETPWLCAPSSPTVCPCQRLRTYSGPACAVWAVTLRTHAVPTRLRPVAFYKGRTTFLIELVRWRPPDPARFSRFRGWRARNILTPSTTLAFLAHRRA